MAKETLITGLHYWKPEWVVYQQVVGARPKVYIRMFWSEDEAEVRAIWMSWVKEFPLTGGWKNIMPKVTHII